MSEAHVILVVKARKHMALKPTRRTLKNGTEYWRVQFRLPGNTVPTSQRFSTVDAALEWIELAERIGLEGAVKIRYAETDGGSTVITAREAFEEYCIHVDAYAEPGTVAKYRRNWKTYCDATFGDWPINHITDEQVEKWITSLRRRETHLSKKRRERDPKIAPDYLSPKTIAHAQGLLSSVLQLQVKRGKLDKNVAKGVAKPKVRNKRKAVFLTDSQVALILKECPTQWKLLVRLLLSSGLRWSEAVALTPAMMDLDSIPAIITVSEAWKRGDGVWYLGDTKSEAGDRLVSIPTDVASGLKSMIRESKTGPNDLIFTGPRGGRLTDVWFHENVWQNLVDRTGITPRPRIHDLRHTHASMLIKKGVPLPYLQKRLGHEKITTTVDTYGHLAPQAHDIMAAATEAAMSEALGIEPAGMKAISA